MARTVNMSKCPACNKEWIADHEEFCVSCSITVFTDLVVHELEKACNELIQLEPSEIKRHKDAISLVADKLQSIIVGL